MITIGSRVRQAQQAIRRQDMQISNWNETQFYPSITNPPSTRIRTRGGTLWFDYDGNAVTIPAGTAEFGVNVYGFPTDSFTPPYGPNDLYEVLFGSAYYYRNFVLIVKLPYFATQGTRYRLVHGRYMTEYATALEAESNWVDDVQDYAYPNTWGYSVCGLILRNDGRTGTANAIMPIDRINRGRSYVWPADARLLDYYP